MLRLAALLSLVTCAAFPAWGRSEVTSIALRTGVEAPRPLPSTDGDDPFPRPELLLPAIGFWTKVFAEYSEHQSAIHSMDYPDKVWAVLDFRDDAQELDEVRLRRLQRMEEERAKREVDQLLKRVHQLQATPDKMSVEERRLYELFADVDDPQKFKKAIGRFRSQRGLQERTRLALETSGKYLPEMERIFMSEGLPARLTRLPLVESSFNVEAYSKVGAAGLWQFIPSSARIYMRLDDVVDDRRDPWTSTHGAARHLKDDYAALGTWPLAVTAYNHGRSGLLRGLREIGGNDLEDLLQRWNGSRFGFASRNFYAEFLAANDVERDYRRHFGEVTRLAPLEFETVETQHYVPFDTLRRLAGADLATFRKLNPAYRDDVVQGRLHVPPSHHIRVPAGMAEKFRLAYAQLDDDERFDEQREYYAHHSVRPGDTLDRIARTYGVTLAALRSVNASVDPRRLRIGQTVRIPPRGGLIRASAKAARSAVQRVEGQTLLHKVQRGETFYSIARRYNTTVEALQRLNGLEGSLLRAGALLEVPASAS